MEIDRLIKGNSYLYKGNVVLLSGFIKDNKGRKIYSFREDRYKTIYLDENDVTENIKQNNR